MVNQSDPAIREEILQKMNAIGERYTVPVGVVPYYPHQGAGRVIRANNRAELQEALGLEHIPRSRFNRAIGSLMYHYRAIARCHIGETRHYKLVTV